MRSFRDIINSWPNVAAFAEDVGKSDTHVRTMRRRNSIPFPYWDAVIEGAQRRELSPVTEQELKAIAKQSPPQRMPRKPKARSPRRAPTIPSIVVQCKVNQP